MKSVRLNKKYKFTLIGVILLSLYFCSWYCVNWFSAGLTDQLKLIEFGMQEDFIYCNDWRPELLSLDNKSQEDIELILKCSSYNYYKVINRLIEKDISLIEIKDEDGFQMIHYAASSGNLLIIQALLEAEHDVNSESNYGDTPLTEACLNNQLEVAKFLIQKGAKVNFDTSEKTPFSFEEIPLSFEFLKLFHENGADCLTELRLWQAIDRNDLSSVRLILENSKDPEGYFYPFGKSDGLTNYYHESQTLEMKKLIVEFAPRLSPFLKSSEN